MGVTQTVAFEILATVEKYRSGLSKMEGITAEAAAKAALRMERELVKGQVASAKAAEKAAYDSAKAFEDGAAEAAEAAKRSEEAIQSAAEEAARYSAELDKVGVEMRALVEGHKASTAETERQASALGLTTGELRNLQAQVEKTAQAERKEADAAREAASASEAAAQEARERAAVLASLTPEVRELAAAEAKATAELEKQASALGVSVADLKRYQGAVDSATDKTGKLGDKAGKTGAAAGKLAGALGLVSPEAAEAARTVADFADVGEVAAEASTGFGVSLGSILSVAGPVAVAIGVLALAYKGYSDELDAAEAKQARALQVSKDVESLTDSIAEAKRGLALAVGGETAAQAELLGITEKWTERAEEANATLAVTRAELEANLAAEQRLVSQGKMKHSAEVDRLTAALAQNAKEQARNTDLATEGARIEVETAEALELRAEAERHAADNAKDLAEATEHAYNADAAWAQALAEGVVYNLDASAAAAKRRAKIEADNAEIITDAEERTAAKRLAGAEALQGRLADVEELAAKQREEGLDKYERAIEDLSAALQDAGIAEGFADGLATVAVRLEQAHDAAGPYLETINAIAAANLSAHMEGLAEVGNQLAELDGLLAALGETGVDAADLSGQALVDAYKTGEVAVDDLSNAQKAALKKQLEDEQAAAEEKAVIERAAADQAFGTQKGVSIANAAVAGLVGAVSAFQLGPIAGAIAAVGIAALTATNIALIASTKPQYHAGGIAPAVYPDETNSTTLPGEGWANRQAMNDPANRQALNAMNAGHSVGGGVTVLRIGRREAREIGRTDIRSNGIIPQTIRAAVRRSSRGAGRSGRGVLA